MADDRRDQVNGDDTRDQDQQAPGAHGTQAGGGPGASDMASPGGSSGAGGYGSAQNQQLHQDQQGRNLSGRHSDEGLSRGERFDEQQGGGRADDAVTITAADRGGGRGKADNDDSIEPDTDEG